MPKQPPGRSLPDKSECLEEAALARTMDGFFDADWYLQRYPDVLAGDLSPISHFIRHGLGECRDPNPFFDSAWYFEHYPDVSVGGMHPLLHYLGSGAAELRNPHPNFDAVWYADQHPEAISNPLLYHVRIGRALGYPTARRIHIEDYLPSNHPGPVPPARIIVDVVIPVYRGLAETRRCIDSVLADPGKPLGRIIVVEDRSPEPGLVAWLLELAAQHRIVLLRNERNAGFVVSVNRGMEAAGSRDVVLLNSDTEVPLGWLSRLTAQAYADPRIATVSPLSNNATICSYPDNAGGSIPFGHTLGEIDEICRTVNAGRWTDAPTTVGFCMYIRRKALREVGAFDEERFTIGYGEENDFCLRATARGWQHRIACDTFVYHKGSVSFGNRIEKLTALAMTLLLERYPDYQRTIARHVGLGAITPYRFAVTAGLFRQAKLPVIVMITHEMGGGVRRHIDMLVQRFGNQARFLLLEATDRGASLSVPSLANHPSIALPTERRDDLIALLRSMDVSRIHIHHLLGMDMDIRALAQGLGVPFDVTVHDYYAICPQINLLPWRHSLYCGEPDVAGCNSCIAHRSSGGARDIITWRSERAWQFREADRVFCPSQDVLTRLQRHGLAEQAVLAPHEPAEAGPWPVCITTPSTGKMRIAVLGTLVNHKGARTVASVAEMADPKTIEIHLIGHTDGPFSERALKRMKVTGPYDDADLSGLIETTAPHLIWFPAVWPETYSYTLSAAIDMGLPVAATRIGAHTERLEGRPYTWLADIATSPGNWIKLFGEIRTRLEAKHRDRATSRRPAVKDFYGAHYLRDAVTPRPRRRRVRPSKPRIAVVPERFDIGFPTPCAYIRLLQPLHHPSVTQNFEVITTDVAGILDCQADIIVTQRYAIPDLKTADQLAVHTKRTGACLAFDLDDDLLDIPRTHADAGVLRPRAMVVRQMLDVADHVWLSTPSLAERLSETRADAMVMENGLDERIWTPPAKPVADQPVRILCMGTTTHDDDFKLIEPALVRLKTEYTDRIIIDVLGMTSQKQLPVGLNRIGPSANGNRSYPGFVHWLSTMQPPWHIGLAPLLDTPFNNAKSAIKAMDYAAMGLAVVASDTRVYRGSIADGPAGLIVPNSEAAWYAALDELLRDRDRRLAIAGQARAVFLARGCLASQAEVRRAAWMRLLEVRRTRAA
jgi:GT2 family glycosyltransferase/glycosyltransferase involved in cell wall biosynthesis